MVTGTNNNSTPTARNTAMAKTKTTRTKRSTLNDTPAAVNNGDPSLLKNALGQIEKAFGKGSIMKLTDVGAAVAGISTGALSLDLALGGYGLPRGRIIELFGPESSGKTTLALHVIASAQKAGGIAAFVDAEHALDPVLGEAAGREPGRSAGQPAVLRGRRPANCGNAHQIQRGRCDRDRLGGRLGAQSGDSTAKSAIPTWASKPA